MCNEVKKSVSQRQVVTCPKIHVCAAKQSPRMQFLYFCCLRPDGSFCCLNCLLQCPDSISYDPKSLCEYFLDYLPKYLDYPIWCQDSPFSLQSLSEFLDRQSRCLNTFSECLNSLSNYLNQSSFVLDCLPGYLNSLSWCPDTLCCCLDCPSRFRDSLSVWISRQPV